MPLTSVLGRRLDPWHPRPIRMWWRIQIPNLTVQLFRQPEGMGRCAAAVAARGGVGAGSGVLLDVHGEIGQFMSVILVPFRPDRRLSPPGGWPGRHF